MRGSAASPRGCAPPGRGSEYNSPLHSVHLTVSLCLTPCAWAPRWVVTHALSWPRTSPPSISSHPLGPLITLLPLNRVSSRPLGISEVSFMRGGALPPSCCLSLPSESHGAEPRSLPAPSPPHTRPGPSPGRSPEGPGSRHPAKQACQLAASPTQGRHPGPLGGEGRPGVPGLQGRVWRRGAAVAAHLTLGRGHLAAAPGGTPASEGQGGSVPSLAQSLRENQGQTVLVRVCES